MKTNSKDYRAKVGRVYIDDRGGKYIRLRCTYLGKRYQFNIGEANKLNFEAARAKAQVIDSDITFERFDPTLAKYSAKHAYRLKLLEAKKQPTIRELWERYKEVNQNNLCHSTKVKDWSRLDKILLLPSNEGLKPNKYDIRVAFSNALSIYAKGSLINPLMSLSGCLTWSRNQGYEVDNPCTAIKQELNKGKVKKLPECFLEPEIKAIREAFKNDTYITTTSKIRHSHYYYYISFLAMTGCRPEEAIALTWKDIKDMGTGVCRITFNKTFTQGKLNPHTKTHVIREFPVNNQLKQLLDSIPRLHDELMFPTHTMKYLRQDQFLNKYWSPIVHNLVKEGKIHKYLPTKNLRHSFITRMLRLGHDVATVARLVGNTPTTIFNNYLAVIDDLIPPDFDI